MYSFAVVGIRLIATYFFVQGLSQSWQLIVFFTQSQPAVQSFEVYTFMVFYVIFYLTIGIVIWAISKWLGKIMLPGNKEEISIPENSDWVAVGTFLIGLYWLVLYLPQALAQTYYALNVQPGDFKPYPGIKTSINFEFIYTHWVVVVFALIIILFSGKKSRFFGWLRKAGTK